MNEVCAHAEDQAVIYPERVGAGLSDPDPKWGTPKTQEVKDQLLGIWYTSRPCPLTDPRKPSTLPACASVFLLLSPRVPADGVLKTSNLIRVSLETPGWA